MEASFKGRKILSQITARLVPPDHTYPDAVCILVMTESHFYVMEDNYDGTYTYHFELPLSKIISVNKYDSERPAVDKEDGYTPSQMTTAVMALAGVVVIPRRGKGEAKKQYLKVLYTNTDDELRAVFFEQCTNMKGMVKAWSRHQSQKRH